MLIPLTSSCKRISVFPLECDFWGSKKIKWTLRRRGGGRGSDLNVQLTLSGGKVNTGMSMAPYCKEVVVLHFVSHKFCPVTR